MNSITKIVVALLVIALIAVVGLIMITKDQGASETTAAATAEPTAQATLTATAEPETTETEVNNEATPQPADAGADSAQADAAANEAQNDDAQGTMYEGALAGLTEEEIAALAMAEEEAMHENGAEDAGAEGAVD